jgi:hypothetical protein
VLCKSNKGQQKFNFIFITQTMDLKKMGLMPMGSFEMQEVEGGLTAAGALTVLGAVGTGLAVVGLICTGPVGVACAIIGGEVGGISSILALFV